MGRPERLDQNLAERVIAVERALAGLSRGTTVLPAPTGILNLTKSGPITDGDFPAGTVVDGLIGVDTLNHRLYVRSGGSWRYVALIA